MRKHQDMLLQEQENSMREISQTDIAGRGARHTVHHSIKEIRVANNDGFTTFTFCGQAHCSLVF